MADPNTLIGSTLGHYRLLEELGAGGMSVVFRAHDEQLDHPHICQVLAPEPLHGQPADAHSDVWALGVVLHEMATGALPSTAAADARQRIRPVEPGRLLCHQHRRILGWQRQRSVGRRQLECYQDSTTGSLKGSRWFR